jgi:hypothetical protein
MVQVGETILPQRTKEHPVAGGQGRNHVGKMLIIGAVKTANNTVGCLRSAAVKDYSAKSLGAFMTDNVAVGATVETDGWSGYGSLPNHLHSPHHIVLP